MTLVPTSLSCLQPLFSGFFSTFPQCFLLYHQTSTSPTKRAGWALRKSSFPRHYCRTFNCYSYLLATCTFTPLYGRLSDVMGRGRANKLAIFFAAVGILACGLSNSMQMLIISRFVSALSTLHPSNLIFVARFLALEVAVYLQPLRKFHSTPFLLHTLEHLTQNNHKRHV